MAYWEQIVCIQVISCGLSIIKIIINQFYLKRNIIFFELKNFIFFSFTTNHRKSLIQRGCENRIINK